MVNKQINKAKKIIGGKCNFFSYSLSYNDKKKMDQAGKISRRDFSHILISQEESNSPQFFLYFITC